MILGRKRRNVTLDTSVLVAWIISKKEGSLYRVVVTKAVTEDRLMLTDVIWDECLDFANKKRGRKIGITKEAIATKLRELDAKVIPIKPVPSNDELRAMGYDMRDIGDLGILYSVNMTDSVILVTKDDDFMGDVKGIQAKIMDPKSYVNEESG
jgi:predicted nucleic acid-binding protein